MVLTECVRSSRGELCWAFDIPIKELGRIYQMYKGHMIRKRPTFIFYIGGCSQGYVSKLEFVGDCQLRLMGPCGSLWPLSGIDRVVIRGKSIVE